MALIGFIIAFSGSSPNAFSQSLVDQHVAATIDFDMNESPVCDLANTQTPNEHIACDNDFGYEIVAAEKEPSPIPLLISKTEDPKQFFRTLIQHSQKKHYCVQPKNASKPQMDAYEQCVDDLPDCDRRTWEESGDGSVILICRCRWFFSSC